MFLFVLNLNPAVLLLRGCVKGERIGLEDPGSL